MNIDLHRRWILNDQQGDAKKFKNSGRKAQLPSRRPEEAMVSVCVKARRSTMRLSKVAALALVAGTAGLTPVSLARAASDCSISVTLADWGENSTGDIDVASGGSCQLPIRLRGTVSSSDISQKPAHGRLKKLNISTYEYTAKSRYKGSDSFAVKAMGQGPTGSGTSVITVRATIK